MGNRMEFSDALSPLDYFFRRLGGAGGRDM